MLYNHTIKLTHSKDSSVIFSIDCFVPSPQSSSKIFHHPRKNLLLVVIFHSYLSFPTTTSLPLARAATKILSVSGHFMYSVLSRVRNEESLDPLDLWGEALKWNLMKTTKNIQWKQRLYKDQKITLKKYIFFTSIKHKQEAIKKNWENKKLLRIKNLIEKNAIEAETKLKRSLSETKRQRREMN